MRFLLDQNVERRLVSFLKNLGHDVNAVGIDYPAGKPDQGTTPICSYIYANDEKNMNSFWSIGLRYQIHACCG